MRFLTPIGVRNDNVAIGKTVVIPTSTGGRGRKLKQI